MEELTQALENPRIRLKEIALIEEALKEDPTLRFTPKYDSKGRRWLFFYEKDDFRVLALREGWKAVRAAYDINHFTYQLLRKELFSEDEIELITKKTETTQMPHKPYKSYELTVKDAYHVTGDTHYTYLTDAQGRNYEITGDRFYYETKEGDTVRFEAKKKGSAQSKGVKFTKLYYARKIEVIGGN